MKSEPCNPFPDSRCGVALSDPATGSARLYDGSSRDVQLIGGDTSSLLLTLMARASCHILPPLIERPEESLDDAIEAMRGAARMIMIGKLPLDRMLWTRSRPYWNGEIANRLNATFKGDAQAYLLLIATAVAPRALYFKRAAPIIVTQSISGQCASGGPFLALLRCGIDAGGRIEAISGHAQAIASPACFFPIFSDFERDIIHILRALQRNLDRYGINLSISRPIDAMSKFLACRLNINVHFQDASKCRLCVMTSDSQTPSLWQTRSVPTFRFHRASLQDGRFVQWLQNRIFDHIGRTNPGFPDDYQAP
ncbi:hypothetical protein SAMN05518849_1329 [Sphingobium sp. AP50]|nr:hypothetical protein SAMN05518849_1329 [Sphingobium sp. AP50]